MKFLTVCIPTYEMHGKGEEFLRRNFDMLARQSFKDFDVVVSDHSREGDDALKNLCRKFSQENLLDIRYFRNTEQRGNSPANLNFALAQAAGKSRLIKILFQDDFLFAENSLETLVKNFDLARDWWLVTGCEHTKDGVSFFRPMVPHYNDKIHLGRNTISSPSVLTIKNDPPRSPLFFDENLIWSMDVDYYKRCYDTFGLPKIVPEITVANFVGEHQISAATNSPEHEKAKERELAYLLAKHHEKNAARLLFLHRIRRIQRKFLRTGKKILSFFHLQNFYPQKQK